MKLEQEANSSMLYDLVAALAVSIKCVDLPIEIKPMQSKSKNFTFILLITLTNFAAKLAKAYLAMVILFLIYLE